MTQLCFGCIRLSLVLIAFQLAFNVRPAVAAPPAPTYEGPVAVLGIPEETEMLAAQLKKPQQVHHLGINFQLGELRGQEVVLAPLGFGKVDAAFAATLLIDHFKPRALIFSGTAGALDPTMVQGDVVIGTAVTYWDFGQVSDTAFNPWATQNPLTGQPNPRFFLADERLLSSARKASKVVKLTKIEPRSRDPKVLEGTIATGDQFVASPAKSAALFKDLGADAVE